MQPIVLTQSHANIFDVFQTKLLFLNLTMPRISLQDFERFLFGQLEAEISLPLDTLCQNTTCPAPAPARNNPSHCLWKGHTFHQSIKGHQRLAVLEVKSLFIPFSLLN